MEDWIAFAPKPVDALRKQLLLWRGLKKELKEDYMKRKIGSFSD